MRARLGEILTAEQVSVEENGKVEFCAAYVDVGTKGPGGDSMHTRAITIYAPNIQTAARMGLAIVDALTALKDEQVPR